MKRHERHSFSLARHSSFAVMLKKEKMANLPVDDLPTPSTTTRDPLIIPLTDKPVDCEPK